MLKRRISFFALLMFISIAFNYSQGVIKLNTAEVKKQLPVEEGGGLISEKGDTSSLILEQTQLIVSALSEGNKALATSLMADLTKSLQIRGLFNNTALSNALITQAVSTPSFFKECMEMAEMADPTNPSIEFVRASHAKKAEGIFSAEYIYRSLRAVMALFNRDETKTTFIANLYILFLWAITLVILGWVLSMFLRCQTNLRHDVSEYIGVESPNKTIIVQLLVLFIPCAIGLPIIYGLGGYLILIYWLFLFLPYESKTNRIISIVIAAVFITTLPMTFFMSDLVFIRESGIASSYTSTLLGDPFLGRDRFLAEHFSGEEYSSLYKLIWGERLVQNGDYHNGETILKDVASSSATLSPYALLWAGNSCYLQNRLQEAIQYYSQAANARADFAEPLLNRSFASNKLFNFTVASADQEAAQKLNPSLLNEAKFIEGEGHIPLFLHLPSGTITEAVLDGWIMKNTFPLLTLPKQKGILRYVMLNPISITAILLLILSLVVVLLAGKKGLAKTCFKCGRPFCRVCKTSLEFEHFCSQCVHLYIKQDGVSPEAKMVKNYEVEHHYKTSKFERAILSILLPGAGRIFEGHSITGTIILIGWGFIVGGLFSPKYFIDYPLPFNLGIWDFYWDILLLIGIIYWITFGIIKALTPMPLLRTK